MLTPYVRLFILSFLAITAIVMANRANFPLLLLASGISLFLLWDYTYRSTVPLAFGRYIKNDMVGADKYLSYISRPHVLNKQNQSKYYFLKGMIAYHKDDFKTAQEHIEMALAIPMKNKTLKITSLLTLTDINIIAKKRGIAKDYFQQLNGMAIPKSLIPTVSKLETFFESNLQLK